MELLSKLGIGPMSSEIIEAVFRYSQEKKEPLMLIASKNQIDWDGGYVNNWRTDQYIEYIQQLKTQYPQAEVYICRDHCGLGFKNNDLKDVKKTIDTDIELGFDLIHIDFCHYSNNLDKILEKSKEVIKYIKRKNPQIKIEAGTDENKGQRLNDLKAVEEQVKYFTNICPIEFFVCQTGSLIKEINQIGNFNYEFMQKLKAVAQKYEVKLKEHNADYLDEKQIKQRQGLVNALNVAPQYGVIQTKLTLQKCQTYGIDFSDFLEQAYQSKKWQKWLHQNTAKNKFLCSVIAGHYVFASDAYREIFERINKYEDFKEIIIEEIMKNIDLYVKNL